MLSTALWRAAGRWSLLLAALALLIGCLPIGAPPTPTSPLPSATVAATAPPMPAEPSSPTARPTGTREIVILHTSDEHGWLLPQEQGSTLWGGARLAAAAWLRAGHDPASARGNTLLLSSGDNWVGPGISTWFEGESTLAVMNAMGYRATVFGNHEFDYSQEVLRRRVVQAQFPYLAANLHRQGTEELWELAQPTLLMDVNDVKIGVVGLALRETPSVTGIKGVVGLTFGDYTPALRRWVPRLRQEGAQVIVVLAHVCPQNLLALAASVPDLGIAAFLGGHCHQSLTAEWRAPEGRLALVGASSPYWRDYLRVRLVYDLDAERLVAQEQALVPVRFPKNAAPAPPAVVGELVAQWEQRTQMVLGEAIGYTARGLAQHSAEMHNLLVDSWLWAYDKADVAISNTGGYRAGITPGQITLADVVGVFPFDNELYEITLTGGQIETALNNEVEALTVGGLVRDGGGRLILSRDGRPFGPQARYTVLVTDYIYQNTKYPFQRYDPEPYEVGIPWRQPVIDWIKAQRSTPQRPIEGFIDRRPRPGG